MLATEDIVSVWRKFDHFPMETLTKAWFYHKTSGKKQRDVSLMKEHRMQYGITGNCFDLAIWLLDEFDKEGITAYPIGHGLNTVHAHVAVIAINEKGNRFLCDLGDQWLNPILIDANSEDYSDGMLGGFFPGAKVQVIPDGDLLEVSYYRPNGKSSRQRYNVHPIESDHFMKAAEFSQNTIKKQPLLECRIPYKDEIAHWEFYNWESFLSTNEGKHDDPKLDNIEQWCERIRQKSGFDRQFLLETLHIYKKMSN